MYNHIYAYLYKDPADSLDQEMRVTSVHGSLDHEKKGAVYPVFSGSVSWMQSGSLLNLEEIFRRQ